MKKTMKKWKLAFYIYIFVSHNVNKPSFFLAFRTYSFRHCILMWVWKGSKRDTLMAFFRKRDTWKTEKIDVKTWSLVQRDPWKIIILHMNAWKSNLLLSVKMKHKHVWCIHLLRNRSLYGPWPVFWYLQKYKGYGSAASVFICSGKVSNIYHSYIYC